jgi:hypothetical protein
MPKITLEFSAAEYQRLADLVAEAAMQSEDDGREGNPGAKLLWQLQKALRHAPEQF